MIRNRLKELMKTYGVSQRQLADRLGKSKSTINEFANEKPYELLEMIEGILDYFDVELDYLLYRERDRGEKEEEEKPLTHEE